MAAIAWSIQQTLFRRDFLDQGGKQVPVEELVSRYAQRLSSGHTWHLATPEELEQAERKSQEHSGSGPAVIGHCPECNGELIMMGGCPTCYSGCGWSKCG